jgi:hypothetical protein
VIRRAKPTPRRRWVYRAHAPHAACIGCISYITFIQRSIHWQELYTNPLYTSSESAPQSWHPILLAPNQPFIPVRIRRPVNLRR